MQHYPLLFYSFANLVNSEFPGKYHVLCFSCSFSNTVKLLIDTLTIRKVMFIQPSQYIEKSQITQGLRTHGCTCMRGHTQAHTDSLSHTHSYWLSKNTRHYFKKISHINLFNALNYYHFIEDTKAQRNEVTFSKLTLIKSIQNQKSR